MATLETHMVVVSIPQIKQFNRNTFRKIYYLQNFNMKKVSE